MQRAGLAVARLACAVAPHAQTMWVACGPGNNGGDGFEAAMHLQRWGHRPVVTFCGDEPRLPADARASLARAREAGVVLASEPPARCDLAIDALLGIGGDTHNGAGTLASKSAGGALGFTQQNTAAARPLPPIMATWLRHMHASAAVVLCVDLPSGLQADTGTYTDNEFATQFIAAPAIFHWAKRLYCLNLLTLKPGVFTAHGKDAAGQVWWDDLGMPGAMAQTNPMVQTHPSAWLLGADRVALPARPHASHKGSFGDVAVAGGAPGMLGAALLAARAALHAGAGRVFVSLLDGGSMTVDPQQPELMFRSLAALDMRTSTVVCGCGGGDAVRAALPQMLSQSPRLVLDADALNAIAADTALQTLLTARAAQGHATILTPHPLEAARLLASQQPGQADPAPAGSAHASQVQAHRLQAAQQLADRFQCTVVLKGAGSIIAAPGQLPCINSSGNAKLATGGTGDVLAGIAGAHLAAGHTAFQAACSAVYTHGKAADDWPADTTLVASDIAKFLSK
jgi:ADP-dependent NAD(P)H-hydrate dehydratase / NAD(P)H-hydrate epimerase